MYVEKEIFPSLESRIILSRTNFSEISRKSDEYLELKLEQLIPILNSDELNVKSEEAVFDAVIKWIDYKVEQRKSVYINELFFLRKIFFVAYLSISLIYSNVSVWVC